MPEKRRKGKSTPLGIIMGASIPRSSPNDACLSATCRCHLHVKQKPEPVTAHLNILPELLCISDFSDLIEVLGIRDTQDAHAGLMPVLPEVALKCPSAPVGCPPADLALELLVEAMQLVQPVGDGLAIPAQGQLQWVVYEVILLITVAGCSLLWPTQNTYTRRVQAMTSTATLMHKAHLHSAGAAIYIVVAYTDC